jgi:DNA-directed RNA polymerase subunit RPC12/RpoP
MFSPYRMRCPKCKTPVTIKKESYIGKNVACKECSTKFVIKAPGKKTSGSSSKKSPKRKVANQVGQDSEFMLALDKLELADESQSVKSLPQAPGRKSKVRIKEEATARKVKKKDTKKKDAISPAVVIGGSILSIAFIGAAIFFGKDYLPALPGGKVDAPEAYSWYTNEDKSFSMKYPEGWEINGGGGVGGKPLWAICKKGSVTIEIRHSMSGSAKGGSPMALPGGQVVDSDGKAVVIPDNRKPVALTHVDNLRKAENKFDKYEESKTKTLKSGMGDCRVSEFTTSNFFGSKGGVRATYLTNRYQLTLYCTCPVSDFREMVGSFMQITQSVTAGGPKE